MAYPSCALLPYEAAFHQPLQLPPDVSTRHRSNMRTVYSCRIPPFELGDRAIGQSQFVMCAPSEIFDDGIKQRLFQPWRHPVESDNSPRRETRRRQPQWESNLRTWPDL